jgi:acid phosphatase (class A)
MHFRLPPPYRMQRRVIISILGACYTLIALIELQAEPPNTPAAPVEPLSWIGPAGKAYVLQSVQPPPAPGSDRGNADLQAVLKAQAERTAGDTKEALADQKFTIGLYASVLSPDFTPENYPVTFDFLNRVRADESFFTSTLQARYKRHRPYEDHPEVKNLFVDEQASDYPGRFAADSRMIMLVLAELFPEKAPALLNRELVITQSGVNAGVLYPSDVFAGKALAHALMYVLQDNPGFDNDMAKARAEIQEKAAQAKIQK